MDPKLELQKIQKEVKNVKATLRWLHKSNKELWAKIVDLTTFLPFDASAPRRAWHILNDVYEMPTCSVSGKLLEWNCFEAGYKKYGDKKSRYEAIANSIKTTVNKQGHWRNTDPEKANKADEKFSEGFKNGKHKPLSQRNIDRKANSEKEKYYAEVWIHTNRNWYEHFNSINPENLQRNDNLHLDHIYSCQQGFLNKVPPEIIGHWTNLRLLDGKKNKSKNNKCDKTIIELYEDFEAANAK